MSVVVVSAGLSVPSSTRLLGERLAAAATGQAPADVRVIELRDLAVDIAHNFTSGFPAPALAEAMDAVAGADGLIVVTPVFSASYSGLFKSFFDVLGVRDREALAGKPVLIAATGGTPRHSLVLDHALRPLFAHLRAVVVPTGVYAASQDWGDKGLDARIERAAGELAALTGALSAASDGADAVTGGGAGGGAIGVTRGGAAGDKFDARNVVPFEEQLAALRSTG
ncbi:MULTISPECIES: CE1759 family FMN reductase [Streptomyces]|uniref:CE1759 family FMN reductase n=1 Tax=Streptomyces TaxID=1883 RepID=UPI0007EDD619|nr:MULTISPECIES: CE1759 family FMN reductase [unclassified Streptomyces]MCP3766284.1 NAD(P)H-dependent oxidoreductase [Streptomyces sp. MAR25Y5]OBQ49457.1 oxidoreductase [Streptomyces sp. H-KF8]